MAAALVSSYGATLDRPALDGRPGFYGLDYKRPAVAVFAIPDRYSGVSALLMSLIVLAGGFVPVAFFIYLFRERRQHPTILTASMQPGAAPKDIAEPTAASNTTLVESISERELEVLSLMARGQSNKEIALALSVTVGTVKTHTNNINRKLGARTRSHAVAVARDLGLL